MNIMRSHTLLIPVLLSASLTSCSGVKNARTETVHVNGDCPMCETRIEKVAFVKGEAEADWDVEAKTARVTYDSVRTTLDAVLKRIAQAGYDSEKFLAPDAAYAALPGCCQYERTDKHGAVRPDPDHAGGMHTHHSATTDQATEHHEHSAADSTMQAPVQTSETFAKVFTHYLALKDALIASDKTKAKAHAEELDGAMHSVDAAALPAEQRSVWTEVMTAIMPHLHTLSETTDLAKQRELFAKLTAPMAQLVKAAPQAQAIYLDHCPMFNGGSDWLSTEKAIKNPFYGNAMLGCGSVKETITGK